MASTISILKQFNLHKLSLIFFLFLSQTCVSADVLVLVHGYRSNASTWDQNGITAALASRGWLHALTAQFSNINTDKIFYTANLPAHAPLMVQTNYLLGLLTSIRHYHPDEQLIVVGHSSGGVVGRLSTLNGNAANVNTLITIASPHLGTYRASQALDVVDSKPFFCPGPGIEFIKSFFGGNDYDYLKDSRYALVDLLPPSSGNLLTWANSRPHPDINYHAVIRYNPGFPADNIVPTYSQDLNQVPALNGKATIWATNSGHMLNPADGQVLLAILDQL